MNPFIAINDEKFPLNAKELDACKIRFVDFDGECTCGANLRDDGSLVDNCNAVGCDKCKAEYKITYPPVKAGETKKKEDAVKTEKTKAPKAKPETKAPKAKPETKAPKADVKKTVKREPGKATARDGSISATELIATGKIEPRENSCAEMVLKNFKKAIAPVKVIDKIVDTWKTAHKGELSATFEKNPRGYIMWTVLDLVRKGGLKKV